MNIIVAIDEHYAIGRNGDLLCHMRADLQHFKALTTGHTVVMGSKTYLSLPRRPLPGRRNIVLTRQDAALFEGAEVVRSIEEILILNHQNAPNHSDHEMFIIGGGEIYRQMMPYADRLYITRIHHTWDDADTFFPTIDESQWSVESEERHQADEQNPYDYTFQTYRRRTNSGEPNL